MKWKHIRKGVIEGELVEDDGKWLTIKLSKPAGNRDAGERLTVRKKFTRKMDA